MKRIIIYSLLAFSLIMSSCSDLLNKEPLSVGTEAAFFKNPTQFSQAANALYQMEGWKDYNGAAAYYKMDQGMDISGFGSNGGASAGQTDFRWDKPYSFIRNCNILLEKATEYAGDTATIRTSIGTAYFFRAWQHFYLLQYFGGVPIADHSFDLNDPTLYGPRNSRYEVVNFIANDLRTAIRLLPKEKNIATADKGKVSQEAAKSFLARVLLYEATWEKYVPTISYDLDGDGTSKGAGNVKPTDYPSITGLLTESKQMAKEVIQEAETGTFQLWNQCDSLSYYYLFNIDDQGGNISNFKNAGKATNKEFIFSSKYDFVSRQGGINLGHTIPIWGGANISTYLGEAFLCRNGLPIRISYTGDMADAQNNPQFLGFSHFNNEYRNRDYRFIGCAYLPDRTSWMSDPAYGIACTVTGQPYPTPKYPKVPYDKNDPAFSYKATVYVPTLYGGTNNGYGCRKFMPEGALRSTSTTESPDYPLIRLAEVHLIYAEAVVELGNGSISDEDLNFSVNKNRTRAGVAPLTNALIANVWDAGWWDQSQNKTVCKKMNMLDEIRRERACELFGEGFRENDLKRWGIAHINLRGQKLGRHVYGTEYMTAIANDAAYHGQPAYQPSKYPLTYGVYDETKGVSTTDPDYGRSIATIPGNLLYSQRDYLAPIPLEQIRLNGALKQNPGW
ncbi:RagB/SusD family nutrient uptake outer membrane protein [Parabacteroides sp. FAFU027]|uniref:RagB/SusD family nutrient uptake outer membrane protein n=1 Tax=Parabacteroides sp. FAFU027 TaxID=2922715 RepID=UPI001FAF99E2|nr:RagB/SusD family nutrient uptake outer membrane protein [Parabacteroides sp. FAFU027]